LTRTLHVDESVTPGDRPSTWYCTAGVYGQARPGNQVVGSSRHRIAIAVSDARSGPSITTPYPESDFQVVMSEEQCDQIERLIVRPTLTPAVDPVLVIVSGPTGSGKTSAAEYAVNEIARRSEGRLVFLSYEPGHFRRWYYGQSEHMVREMGETVLEFGRAGHPVLVLLDDSEQLMQSRQFTERQSCGGTVAGTTSALLAVLDKLKKDPALACTVLVITNYGSPWFDPALTSHRLRGVITFGTLDMELVPAVIAAHAPRYEFAGEDVTRWLGEVLVARTTLARGRRGNIACEITLADCLTPSMVSEVLNRAHLLADPEPIEQAHARAAYTQVFGQLAERIVAHAHSGDVGMIVPALSGAAADLQLRPAFEPALETQAQAELDGVVVPV